MELEPASIYKFQTVCMTWTCDLREYLQVLNISYIRYKEFRATSFVFFPLS